MRTETITKTVYTFDELSDQAKERAREWWHSGALDYEWWDCTYEDAVQCAAILGIEIRSREPRAVASIAPRDVRYNQPAIWFSGFWSQGDGACFEGTWSWQACGEAIRKHAPQDAELHRIADVLTALPYGEGWRASTKHRGHYYHSGCMTVDVEFEDEFYAQAHDGAEDKQELPQAEFTAGEDVIVRAMRDFADWIYSQLEKESEYILSDENTDESIRVNEYEFDEDGNRA